MYALQNTSSCTTIGSIMQVTPTFKLSGRGIERILGKLESKVMQVVWDKGEASIGQVQKELSRKDSLAFTTVMTTMNRLVVKGLLKKKKGGRYWLYTPKLSKEEFTKSFSRQVVKGLLDDFGKYAIAHFVREVKEADRELLKELLGSVASKKHVKKKK